MKTVVLLVLVALVLDGSYAWLISEDETLPLEDEHRLKRKIFLRKGSYILSQDIDDNDINDSSENKGNNDDDDDVENGDSEESTFENSVNDFEMGRTRDNLSKEVSDPFRVPRHRRQGGRRSRRRQGRRRLNRNRRRRWH